METKMQYAAVKSYANIISNTLCMACGSSRGFPHIFELARKSPHKSLRLQQAL